jgi:hypothetical protein
MRSVAKSYMRKGFLIYAEMRKYYTILGNRESYMTLLLISSEFPYTVYEENLVFFFISA